MNLYENTEKTLTNEDLSLFEKQLNVILPESFKNHFMQNNGGYPPYNYVLGEKNVFSIDGFIAVLYGKLPIEKIIADYKEQGIEPGKRIPFASDAGGNLFWLDLTESDNYGKVYIAPHENTDEFEKSLLFVISDFEAFIKSLSNEL